MELQEGKQGGDEQDDILRGFDQFNLSVSYPDVYGDRAKEQPVIHEVDLNRIRLVEPKRLPRWVALVGTLLVIGMFMWLVGEFVKGFSQ